jgi:hypothetical protein
MNASNLQLQGLYLVLAQLLQTLSAKGVLNADEINDLLARAEQLALGDERVFEDMNPASRDALAFPARLLRLANRGAEAGDTQFFSELARQVGQTKGHYPDEL